MKAFRIGLWTLTGVVALALAFVTVTGFRGPSQVVETFGTADIGGPFALVNTQGETVTRDDLIGKPHAVFFGYTYCPDVCPTTMWELGSYMQAMGERADDMEVVFVSVDPERDTPDALREYVSAFDPRITALTGSRESIDEMVRNYRAYYKIHEPDENGDVLIDHTANVFLFDADGGFAGTIAYQENPQTALAKLERLVEA